MFETEIYVNRRKRLATAVNKGLILLLGNEKSPINAKENTYQYRQDSTFRYLFGINQPGFAAIIDIDNNKEYLFANDFNINELIWIGNQSKVIDLAERVGVKNAYPLKDLETVITKNIHREIHYLPPYRSNNMLRLSNLLGIPHTYLESKSSKKLINALVELRSKKEDVELVEIKKASNIGYKMQTTAMRLCHAGRTEREIAGIIEGIALSEGLGVAFPIILSQNSQTLHNYSRDGILTTGKLMLNDCGAETISGYVSDLTRTSPVGGNFSTKQKEIYNIVLEANNIVHSSIKAGVSFKKMHLLACKTITKGLIELGIMFGDPNEAVKLGAHALFMPHGLGHLIGSDVHDMADYGDDLVGYDKKTKRSKQFGLNYLRLGRKLEEGFVISNEPGIYFIPNFIKHWKVEGKFKEFINYEKLENYMDFGGIRLEDNLLVTKKSCEFLGDKRIPITIEEVEECVKSGY